MGKTILLAIFVMFLALPMASAFNSEWNYGGQKWLNRYNLTLGNGNNTAFVQVPININISSLICSDQKGFSDLVVFNESNTTNTTAIMPRVIYNQSNVNDTLIFNASIPASSNITSYFILCNTTTNYKYFSSNFSYASQNFHFYTDFTGLASDSYWWTFNQGNYTDIINGVEMRGRGGSNGLKNATGFYENGIFFNGSDDLYASGLSGWNSQGSFFIRFKPEITINSSNAGGIGTLWYGNCTTNIECNGCYFVASGSIRCTSPVAGTLNEGLKIHTSQSQWNKNQEYSLITDNLGGNELSIWVNGNLSNVTSSGNPTGYLFTSITVGTGQNINKNLANVTIDEFGMAKVGFYPDNGARLTYFRFPPTPTLSSIQSNLTFINNSNFKTNFTFITQSANITFNSTFGSQNSLSYCWIESNITGERLNASYTALSGTTANCSISLFNNNTAFKKFYVKLWANDSGNTLNSTLVYTYTIAKNSTTGIPLQYAYYTYDSDTNDSINEHEGGTFSGIPMIEGNSQVGNGSIHFTSDTIRYNLSLEDKNLTIVFWEKTISFTTGTNRAYISGIVSKSNDDCIGQQMCQQIYISQTPPYNITYGESFGIDKDSTTGATPQLNQWTCLGAVWNGTHITSYFNGAKNGSVSNTLLPDWSFVSIGKGFLGYVENVYIDDLQIWDSALTPAQMNESCGSIPFSTAPNIETQIACENATSGHTFTCTANATDYNGTSDIKGVFSNSTASATITNLKNTTQGINFGAKFNYSGTALASTTITITFMDSLLANATTNTYLNVFPNQKPTTLSASLNKSSNVADTEDLKCVNDTSSDIDGDSITLLYEWYKNTITQNIGNQVLGNGNTSLNDIWYCKIIPYDGYENGTAQSSVTTQIGLGYEAPVITITNSTTALTNIISNSSQPTNNDTWINLSVYFTDANNPTNGDLFSAYFYKQNGCSGATWNETSTNLSGSYLSVKLFAGNLTSNFYEYWVCVLDNTSSLSTKKYGNFSINHPPENLTLTRPLNNSWRNVNYAVLNYSASEMDGDNITYFVYGNYSTPYKLLYSGSNLSFNWTELEENRNYTWYFFVSDIYNYNSSNSTEFTLKTDYTNPSLTIIEPSGTYTSQTAIPIKFSATDNNRDSCFYFIKYTTTNATHTSNTSISCSANTTFDVTANTAFTMFFYVNDSAGNLNLTEASFTTTSSSGGTSGGGGGGGGGSSTTTIISKGTGNFTLRTTYDSPSYTFLAFKGTERSGEIALTNLGNDQLTIDLSCEKGNITENICSWITIQNKTITLPPNRQFILYSKFIVKIPENAKSDTYYASIIGNDQKGNQQALSLAIKVVEPLGIFSMLINKFSQSWEFSALKDVKSDSKPIEIPKAIALFPILIGVPLALFLIMRKHKIIASVSSLLLVTTIFIFI